MLAWAVLLLLLNLWWSRRINRTLEHNRHLTDRLAVLNNLLLNAGVWGAIWGGTLIWLDSYLSDLIFYLSVGVVAIITAVTLAVLFVIRQAYLTQLVFSLGSIALWQAWHAEARPFSAGFATLLVSLGYQYFLLSLASG